LHLRYDDELALLAKGVTVLQGMIDRLMNFDTCYGMKKNVDKTQVMRLPRIKPLAPEFSFKF
jgi:hypothetical protein